MPGPKVKNSKSQLKEHKEYIFSLICSKKAQLIDIKILIDKCFSKVWTYYAAISLNLEEDILIKKDLKFIIRTFDNSEVKVALDFVSCKDCHKVFVNDRTSNGTGSLINHKKSCTIRSNFQNLDQFTKPTLRKLSELDKKEVDDQVIKFIAKGLRPMSMLDDDSFRDLIQRAIAIGSKYGYVTVDNIINHRNAYKEKLNNKYDHLIDHLHTEYEDLIGISCTTDLWTEPMTSRKFICLTVHHANQGTYKNISRIVACEEIACSTGEAIRKWFDMKMELLKLNKKKIIVVTDNASNLSVAFNSSVHLSCSCHNLNLVVQDALSFTKDLDTYLNTTQHEDEEDELVSTSIHQNQISVNKLLERCKRLVKFAKKSSIQGSPGTTLKQSVSTRWNSDLIMAQSVIANYSQLENILVQKRALDCLFSNSEMSALKEVCNVLKDFNDTTVELSSQSKPTLPYVVMWHDTLVKCCEPQPSDSLFIIDLKRRLHLSIKDKWDVEDRINLYHYVALMLDPRYRELKFVTDSHREKIMNLLTELVNNLIIEDDNITGRPVVRFDTELRQTRDIFQERMDLDENISSLERSRELINHYCQSKIEPDSPAYFSDDRFNPIKFWVTSKDRFKYLSSIALWLLSCPASSVSSESCFSRAGYLVNPRRNRLASKHINNLIVVHSLLNK